MMQIVMRCRREPFQDRRVEQPFRINDERLAEFENYERQAAKLLEKHGGRIERAVRVENSTNAEDAPFEIHFVSFPNEQKFADYLADSEMRQMADLRGQVIVRTVIFSGFDANFYHE